MIRRFLIVISLLAFLAGSASALPCETVKAQPDAWIARRIDSLVTAAHGAYEKDEAFQGYEMALDAIVSTIRRCRLSEDAGLTSKYREFFDYVKETSYARLPGHELGFNVSDKQYFEETSKFVEIPQYLLDPIFLRLVSRFEFLDKAKDYLRALNKKRPASDQLIFFSYSSQHLGTPDNNKSFRRLLIVVPGNASAGVPEKWVQFGITDPGKRVHIRNMSIVSAVPGANGTYDSYFKDFFRTYRADGTITIKGRSEAGYGDDNCAQCHKSGILPIFPQPGTISPDEEDELKAVNDRFETYGSPRFGKYLDSDKLGPGISSMPKSERDARLGAGFSETTVGKAMTCTSCHNAEEMGSFNWPMDRTILGSFIKGGKMPFRYHLAEAERVDLYNKLIAEYFATDAAHPGVLKSWLLGRRR